MNDVLKRTRDLLKTIDEVEHADGDWEVLIAGDPDACWPWTIPDPNNQPRSMRDPEWRHYTVYGDQPLWREDTKGGAAIDLGN